jgi:DNA polymerase-3 subunit epsilon
MTIALIFAFSAVLVWWLLRTPKPRSAQFSAAACTLASSASRAAIVDCETTGLDANRDEIVELAVLLIDCSNPESPEELGFYCGTREPSVPISAGAARVNHMTLDMVRGTKLEDAKIAALISQADVCIAHNVNFERKFLRRIYPKLFAGKSWGCTCWGIDWPSEECERRALDYLMAHYSIADKAKHRAGADCRDLLTLLQKRNREDQTFLSLLLANAGRPKAKRPEPSGRKSPSIGISLSDEGVTLDYCGKEISQSQLDKWKRPAEARIEELMELLKSIVADGQVSDEEFNQLDQWLEENSSVCHRDCWPENAIFRRVYQIKADGEIGADELEELRDLVLHVLQPGAIAKLAGPVQTAVLTEPPPVVQLRGRAIAFAGKFVAGTHAAVGRMIQERGSRAVSAVGAITDYLVIGGLSLDNLNTGRARAKLEQAVTLIKGGAPISIISEERLMAALEKQPDSQAA